MHKIAVIGAGVIGLTTAVNLQELYGNQFDITIICEKLSPYTTGDGSAGLWGPYLLGETPANNIIRWSKITHDYFHLLWQSGLSQIAGICLQPCIRATKDSTDYEPAWKSVVYGFNNLTPKELKKLNNEHKNNYSGAAKFITFTCEPVKLLPYLLSRFTQAGGKIIIKRVETLSELQSDYDAVVNCCGLGARELIGDTDMHAIRGQVARVRAPWQFYTFLDESDDGNYIITNMDTIVLGGTHQEGDTDLKVRKKDSDMILSGCYKLIPSLQKSTLINEWVGLRPGRRSIRLEYELLKTNIKSLHIVHNYGHGGSGVTLCWGCAQDAAKLIGKAFKLPVKTNIKHKL